MSRQPLDPDAAYRLALYSAVGAIGSIPLCLLSDLFGADFVAVIFIMIGWGLAAMYCPAIAYAGFRMKLKKVILLGALGTLSNIFWWLWVLARQQT